MCSVLYACYSTSACIPLCKYNDFLICLEMIRAMQVDGIWDKRHVAYNKYMASLLPREIYYFGSFFFGFASSFRSSRFSSFLPSFLPYGLAMLMSSVLCFFVSFFSFLCFLPPCRTQRTRKTRSTSPRTIRGTMRATRKTHRTVHGPRVASSCVPGDYTPSLQRGTMLGGSPAWKKCMIKRPKAITWF